MTITKKEAMVDFGYDVYRFLLNIRVHVVDAERSVSRALVTRVVETRNITDYHGFMGHTNK